MDPASFLELCDATIDGMLKDALPTVCGNNLPSGEDSRVERCCEEDVLRSESPSGCLAPPEER